MAAFRDEVTGLWVDDDGFLDNPQFFILDPDGCAVACADTRPEANRLMLKLGVRATHRILEV